ncbi:MAG: RibD family protein, partial [Gemmatimonadota bacterium]
APDSALARSVDQAPVRVLVGADAAPDRIQRLRDAGVDVAAVPGAGDRLDLAAALDRLWADGVRTVFCEGGGRLGAALLSARRVDRLYLIYAPTIFGEAGVPAFPGAVEFRGKCVDVQSLGGDIQVTIDGGG